MRDILIDVARQRNALRRGGVQQRIDLDAIRASVERAPRYLRPAATAGDHVPYDRDVLLAGIAKQLAVLDGTRRQ